MRLLCRCSTTTRLLVLLLLCTHISITYAAVLDSCATSADCDSTPNTDCTGSPLKCNCDTGFKGNIGDAGCIAKTVGDSCTGDSDCVYIARAECSTGTCTCSAGYTGANGAASCTVIQLGNECVQDSDCSGVIANSQCDTSTTPDSCACNDGYRASGSDTCLANKIEDACTVNLDCSTVTNSQCSSGTCACLDGHTPSVDKLTCADNVVGSTCSSNTDCVSIANAECVGSPLQCTCSSGHISSGDGTTCNQITLGSNCTLNSECSSIVGSVCESNVCKCQEGYTGSDGTTTCAINDCGQPTDVEGYTITAPAVTTFQAQTTVVCAEGYETNPDSSTITCQASSSWTTPSGCSKVDCGAPSATAGYTVGTYSTTDFQSTVPMNCATGYTGSAADITCQANRTWTPPSGCTIVDCGTPDTPGYTFGTPTPSTTYLDTVSITGCATGYDGSPTPSSLTCEASGNWATHSGCTIKDCNTPTADTGYLVGLYSATTYGSSSTMSCATGYDGTAADITCAADGFWSSQTGCSIVDCSTPSETGYDFTGTTVTTYLGTSNAACATGYDGTASPAQITCEDSGSWTTVTGCTIKDCSTPSETGYDFTGTTATTYLGTSNAACATGYDGTASPAQIQCEDSGSWTTVTGCTIKDCSTPSETGYDFTGTSATTYLGTSNAACATGYDGTASPAQVVCEASGNWTAVTGCTIKDCSTPSETGYDFTGTSATTYLGTSNAACATGYDGTASPAQVVCEASGNWTAVTGCTIKDCSTPSETGYDFSETSATTYLGTSYAACATGYDGTASPALVQCEASGSWTAVTGCTIKDCSTPSETGYDFTGTSATTYLGTSNAACATGYDGTASPAQVVCEANGSWTAVTGCTIKDCSTPSETGYVFTGTTATTYLGTSNVACATGYDGTASPAQIQCEASGSWTVVTGCTIKDCNAPTADTGYVVDSYSATTYDSSSTMLCATGYEGTPADITCTAGGTWSSQTGCSIVDCSTPSETGYDFTGTSATTYLGTSNAACATGYDGTASPAQVQCEASGNWTTVTGCTIKDCSTPSETGYDFTGTSATTYLGTSNAACATGYDGTASPAQVVCEASGIWTAVTGCTIKDCSTPSETGYDFTGTSATTYLGTSNAACATGYDGTASPAQVVCEASGSWTAVTGCTIKDCSTPSETGYDFTGTSATTYLGTSNAACATGYDGTASPAQVVCEASGSWTAVTGCTIKDCSTPSETGYDFTGTSATTYLGTSNAACATGYDGTASPAQVVCEASGSWTAVTGCTIKDCSTPSETGYDFTGTSATTYLGTSNAACATGYDGTASPAQVVCEASGSWTAVTGCTIKDCGTPSETGYDFTGTSATTYLGTSNAACATGYDGTASPAQVVCEASGSWTAVTGCTIKDCSTPSETGYVFTGTSATTYLGTSNAACATGYDGTASPAQVVCEASGSWTAVTGCTIKDCSTPSETGYDFTGTSATTYLGTSNAACATGYDGTASPAQVVCEASGSWTAVTGCTIEDCSTPSETGYDFTGTSATTYLGTSNAACATGYDGTASPAQVVCEASGSWTAVTGCTIKDCSTPSETGYDFTGTSATTYLGTSNAACATGYDGTASPAQVVCEASGSWTAVTGCTIKDCSTPSETGYDFTGTTATTYLGTSNAACATGYDGTALPAQVQCGASGNWTAVTGCTIKDCSTPSETGYDFTGTTATTYLGTSNAACATGYDGTASPAQVQCEASGSWTAVTGCTIKDCNTPSETGYDFTGTSATTYLGTSNAACATGYDGSASPAQVQCEASGSWTAVTGCTIKDCNTPTADTGYLVGVYSTTTYGSSSTMSCATGYEGTAADITCTADGTWSSQTGCSIVDCSTPTETGYDFTGTSATTYLGTSNVACATGYDGTASPVQVQCEASGNWTTLTGCTIKDCSIPSETGYDFTGTTATTYLGTSNAACATGYEGTASPAQIQCEAGGSWTTVTGCNIKDCNTPTETGYDFTGMTATTYLGTANIACATGYDGTASPAQIQCEASGNWTTVTGCTITDCNTPSETGFDFTGTTATTYLGTSNAACATGYDGTASPAQVQCEASGSWTAVTGCTIKDCNTPSDTGYDFTGTTATTYLGTSNAACATGYDGTASPAQIQCEASGNWTTVTGCTIKDCSTPTETGYDFTGTSATTYLGTSNAACATGYDGTASPAQVQCEANGNWTTVTGCTIKDCSTPSETGYDFTGTTATTYLGTSNAACATGYEGTPSPTQIQCEAGGSWTAVTGCTIKDCRTPTVTGYDFTGTSATTYLGTSNAACATGYDGTASPAQIQCEANGSWTTVSGCGIIDCNTPSETGYDFTGTTATTYLGTSNAVCATGYDGTASPAQIQCEASGNWTAVTGCNIKDCSTPTEIGYDFTGTTVTTYLGTSNAACATGYDGTASPAQIQCEDDGNWSAVTGCTIKDCNTPTETGYVFTGTTATTYLGTSNVACATGYDGTASPAQVQCEASGNWTTVTGCIIKDCSSPSEAGYDFTGTTDTTYLGTSNVACATGYDGTASPAQIQCEASGDWTTVSGCTIKDCNTPIETGYDFTGTTATTYLGTSNAACAIGYDGTASPAQVQCEDSGSWTTVTGCTIKDCSIPSETGYDFTGTTATTYLGTSNVACATGYDGTASPPLVQCEASGIWTVVTGCTKKDCSTPSETGYEFTGTTATTYLGTSNVTCATGYDGTASPPQIQCEASGSWTAVTGCTIKDCSTPSETGYDFTGTTVTTYLGTSNAACATGYDGTASPAQIQCEASGDWTIVTGCTIKDCSNPDETGYNFTDITATTYLGAANVACAYGYNGTATPAQVQCEATGSWTALSGCTIINCGDPTAMPGYVRGIYSSTTFASAATMYCATGYTGTAAGITCEATGDWSPQIGCTIVDCNTPSLAGYRYTGYSVTTYNEQSDVTCALGYDGTASPSTVTCMDSGDWTTVTGCTIKDCATPSETGYSFADVTSTTYEGTATVTCATGYEGTATPNSVSCEASGSWTSVTGCTIKVCGALSVDGYSFSTPTANTFGGTASVACATGYNGTATPASVECEDTGTWTTVSGCSIIDCGTPSTTGYVYTSTAVTTYGATTPVECAEGYGDTASPSSVSCEATGNWGTVSGCTIKDCGNTLPQPTNGVTELDTTGVTTFGSTATQSCNTGYDASGTTQLTCLASGQWQTFTLTCTIKNCGQPSALGYDLGNIGTTTYLSTVQVTSCATGYTGTLESSEIQCQSNGQWSVPEGCAAVDCGTPSETTGYVLGTVGSVVYQSTRDVTCAVGYAGSPDPILCQANASWTEPSGCVLVDCGSPEKLGYNLGTPTALTYGGTVSVTSCATGYNGTVTITEINCQDTGLWSDPEGCTIIDCGNPPEPDNGAVELQSAGVTTYGARATQSCNTGYDTTGTTTIECMATGSWSAGPVQCIIKNCGRLLAPVNGAVNGAASSTSNTFGSTVTFTCNTGFQLAGASGRTCESNGQWSERANPICENIPVACGDLPDIPFSSYSTNALGTVVTYTCDPGYQIDNNNARTVRCTGDTWSSPQPTCSVQGSARRIPINFTVVNVNIVNLNDPPMQNFIIRLLQPVLQQNFVRNSGLSNMQINILSVRSGSLIIDAEVIIPEDTGSSNSILNATSLLVFNDETIEVDGQVGTFQKIEIINETFTKDNMDAYLCTSYEYLEGTCQSGYECVATINSGAGAAECRQVAKKDNLGVIIGVGVGVPVFLLLVIIFVSVGIYIRRKDNRRHRKYEDSSSESDDRSQFGRQMPVRYTGRHTSSANGIDGPAYYETYDNSQGSGFDQPTKFYYPWDYLSRHIAPGKKMEIKRPKY